MLQKITGAEFAKLLRLTDGKRPGAMKFVPTSVAAPEPLVSAQVVASVGLMRPRTGKPPDGTDADATVRTWRWIVYQYHALTVVGSPTAARRRDYLSLCWRWSRSKEKRKVLRTVKLEELTLDEAEAVVEQFRRIPAEFFGREFARLFPNIWAWDYSAIASPKEFRKMVEHAEVVFAVDWNTGAYNFAFGFEALESTLNGRSRSGADTFGTITFAVEFDTPQLTKFLEAIKSIKGWAEWNGEIQ